MGLSGDKLGPFAMPTSLATSPSSQAPPVFDQGDGCTACPSLQGALTDVSGLPGKPGPKGEPGPEGVGRPGKPVSAIGSSSHPSLSLCCVLYLPNTPRVSMGSLVPFRANLVYREFKGPQDRRVLRFVWEWRPPGVLLLGIEGGGGWELW